MNSEYLLNLNERQQEAVLHLDGPLLIVAGAGSGKTRVLTTKIAHIINEKRIFPNQILAVTFTNKAANEMRKRVSNILNKKSDNLLRYFLCKSGTNSCSLKPIKCLSVSLHSVLEICSLEENSLPPGRINSSRGGNCSLY